MLTRGNVKPLYYRILSKFPQNFSFCFAYGSKVKPQIGYDSSNQTSDDKNVPTTLSSSSKKPVMLDLMFAVENPFVWHGHNALQNPSHYSFIRHLGSNFIAKFQENYAAKVYCNTLIPIEDEKNLLIKYGVISTKDLVEDLLDWRDLYVAGRLQKPVEIIRGPNSSKVQNALELNLQSAIHSALLLLPKDFSEFDFYCTITSLSYNGDFRMIFGENKNKVQNIVKAQVDNFRSLYAPVLELYKSILHYSLTGDATAATWQQDKTPVVVLQHLNQLPKWPIRRIVKEWNRGRYRSDTEDVLRAVACSPHYQDAVKKSLADIVWQSSVKQSLKNIPTAGIFKSLSYSWSKALKTFNL
jgi:mitochondrial translocator assembly and maintenance protein 41